MEVRIKKGFITLAIGKYYCQLAENLYKSYKVFSDGTIPFWVITDKVGAERLRNLFDGVIVLQDSYGTFLDKIRIYDNTPFKETIFIDADSNVVRDITYLFKEFETEGSAISAISNIKSLEGQEKGHLFGKTFKETFDIRYDFPNFNGGVYYFNKSQDGDLCMDFILNELLPKYTYYELNLCNNGTAMHDEPLFIAGMLRYNMKTVDINKDIMRLVYNYKNVEWDMKRKNVTYQWWDQMVSPDIIHWKTDGTLTLKYVHYNAIVSARYYKIFTGIVPFYMVWKDFLFLYEYKFVPWIKMHFTLDYVRFTWRRIVRRLGKR